jgi:hypothetical protein
MSELFKSIFGWPTDVAKMLVDEELSFQPMTNSGLAGTISSVGNTTSHHSDPSNNYYASIWHGGFPDESSLFEELGIHDTNIVTNLKVILLPMSQVKTVDDNFLIGLLFFCGFAGALLLLGKVRFGMVYMIGLLGCALLYYLFNFMSRSEQTRVNLPHLFTALSYCTIPLTPFVLIVGLFRLTAVVTTVVSVPFLLWSALSATRYVMTQLVCEEIRALVFTPLFLFYAFLLLLPIY